MHIASLVKRPCYLFKLLSRKENMGMSRLWCVCVCVCVRGGGWKVPFFWHPGICTYFLLRDFFEALGITWIDCDICVITSKKWVQKVKGQYMNMSTFWMIKYMNGSVFSKARYMNGVGFEILARTPIPKLPVTPRPPPSVSGRELRKNVTKFAH